MTDLEQLRKDLDQQGKQIAALTFRVEGLERMLIPKATPWAPPPSFPPAPYSKDVKGGAA